MMAKKRWCRAAHDLLSEADVVVHYNGDKFDLPHLNREFVESGLGPPAPYASIDLLKTVKRKFRFPSNKLDYVVQKLRLGAKVSTGGYDLSARSAWLGRPRVGADAQVQQARCSSDGEAVR